MNNGGPAFPVSMQGGFIEGMTLRDYFAAKFGASFLMGCAFNQDAPLYVHVAEESYKLADAMLRARKS